MTQVTVAFAQPGYYGQDATVTVDSTRDLMVGQTVLHEMGGFYMVDSIVDEHTVNLMNLAYPQNFVATGTEVVPRGLLVPTGLPQGLATLTPPIPNYVTSYTLIVNGVLVLTPGLSANMTLTLFGMAPPIGTRVVLWDSGGNLGGSYTITVSAAGGPIYLPNTGPWSGVWSTQYGVLDMTFQNPDSPIWLVTSQL
jgi:hypothetical protein